MAIKPVVVGVDGSEESLLAAEWAAMEAKRHDRPLRISSGVGSIQHALLDHARGPVAVVPSGG
jgi:nucleotide-binding universal stress UspA family protein